MGWCHKAGCPHRPPACSQRSTALQHSRIWSTAAWQELSSRRIPKFATASCDPPGGMCHCALPAGARICSSEGCSIRAAAIAYAIRLIPGGRYEKRIGETKNEFIFGVSPVCVGKPFPPRHRGGRRAIRRGCRASPATAPTDRCHICAERSGRTGSDC